MITVLKSQSEQSDYPDGCLQITAENEVDAFELGQIFADLIAAKKEVVRLVRGDSVSIRVPLQPEIDYGTKS